MSLNIPISKSHQANKVDDLKEYGMRNTFWRKHTQNVVGKLVPESFIKNQD